MHEVKDQPLDMTATLQLLQKLGGEWSASEKEPFGPTEECFSVERMVYLSRRGATMRDLYHLSRCDSCRNWMSNFVQVRAKLPALAKSELQRNWWRDVSALFGAGDRVAEADEPNMILYLPFTELAVSNLAKPNLSVEFGILSAPTGNLDEIDVSSLRLFGALTGEDAILESAAQLGLPYRVARFQKVDLGKAARKDLSNHREASHIVRLSGRFKGAEAQELRGQAYVNLSRG